METRHAGAAMEEIAVEIRMAEEEDVEEAVTTITAIIVTTANRIKIHMTTL